MRAAADLGLPVQVLCRMQDWRIQWMLHTEDVGPDRVARFLDRVPTAVITNSSGRNA